MGGEVRAAGDFQSAIDQVAIVRAAHVGEARAERIFVDADQRIAVHQVDVIFHDHHVAAAVVRIQSAAGVGDDQQIDAQGFHHAHRQRDLPGGIAFVEMKAALHGNHGQTGQRAAHQLAFVADGGRDGKVRDFFVRNVDGRLDRRGQIAQTGAEDDAGARFGRPAFLDEGGGFGDFWKLMQHE